MKQNTKTYLMKCLSCDKILNDREASRKYASSGEHVDLCNRCFSYIEDQVPTEANLTLKEEEYEYTLLTPHEEESEN